MLQKIRSYAQLLRVRHWLKNILILIPAFYGGVITEPERIGELVLGFLTFAFCSSAIYVINDLCDIEKDRQHPVKCKRPLASGAVSKREGIVLFVASVLLTLVLDVAVCGLRIGVALPLLYLLLNILYSKGLKNRPVVDLVILVSGFVIRMVYGSYITDVLISGWLYMTLIALSLFMAFGKRRNEKLSCGDTSRAVLGAYSATYLNSSMYMYLGIFLVFYALWSMDTTTMPNMIYTTPLVMVMMMRYTYDLEQDEHGNPVDMVLGDKLLLGLGVLYAAFIFVQIYFPEVLA